MKRSEIEQKYKWNLDDIFYNVGEWEKEYAALNKAIVAVLKYNGKLSKKETLLECLKFNDGISKRLEKLYCYTMFLKDENGVDNTAITLKARAESMFVQYGSMSAFVTPEISALPEELLNDFINDADFSDYDYMLKNIIRDKKHILSKGEERILALGGNTFSAFSNIFSNIEDVDLPLPFITVDGKREKMTHGKYSLWLSNRDGGVRKKAFNGMYKAIESLINTIAANYAASVIKDNYLANVRGYKDALTKSLSGNDIPIGVYDMLIKKAGDNISVVHDYVSFRKKVLKADSLHMYDLYVPMFDNAELKLKYEEAYKLVLDGLKPLGDEYSKLLSTAYEKRWIDVYETENKHSGAYSCGVNGVHPYVLLNYTETTHNIFTIAHELGHAIHSYYSSLSQPYAKSDYAIFVAEVASTVNEVLLLKHLISVTKDINIKKYLFSYYLDMFRTTLFRQTMFAEFEQKVHNMEQKVHTMEKGGQPLTVESLSKTYLKLNKKYYGPDVKHDKYISYEWARIPHFYRAFYVYQYATGLTSAVNIANDILKNGQKAVDRYKAFLSSGGSKSPYEILADAGVDLMTDKPYDTAFKEFGDTLAELKKLV